MRSRAGWLATTVVVAAQLVGGVPTPGTEAAAVGTGDALVAGTDRRPGPPGALVSTLLGTREPAPEPAAGPGTSAWGWPLAGRPSVVRGFDPPARRWLPGHRGIDLAALEGESVLAVDDGVVTFSGSVAGVGVVSLTHADGLRSTYQPVTEPAVHGQRVRGGERIGRVEATGSHCAPRVCLHLGAVRGRDDYVDPTPLLLGVELALLPVQP